MVLYDTFWHPSKYAYNLDYINMGLRCLEEMVNDQPITNARQSIRQILKAVEQAIFTNTEDRTNLVTAIEAQNQGTDRQPAPAQSSIHFPSFANNISPSSTDDFIYFNSRYNRAEHHTITHSGEPSSSGVPPFHSATWVDDPMSSLDFDVLTTDLFNFLPAPMEDNGNDLDVSQG